LDSRAVHRAMLALEADDPDATLTKLVEVET
jgi:hypothetical protein